MRRKNLLVIVIVEADELGRLGALPQPGVQPRPLLERQRDGDSRHGLVLAVAR